MDKVQRGFVKRLGLTEVDALVEFRLAPLSCRRDIAMLGVLHRAALQLGPEHFQRFFYKEGAARQAPTRAAARRHSGQLADYRKGRFLEVLRRSAFGLVAVYNRLPAEVVAANSVKDFQRLLQNFLTARAVTRCGDWQDTFSPRVYLWRHPLR